MASRISEKSMILIKSETTNNSSDDDFQSKKAFSVDVNLRKVKEDCENISNEFKTSKKCRTSLKSAQEIHLNLKKLFSGNYFRRQG